jgi:hypothetical protein
MSVNGDRLIEEAARMLEPGSSVYASDGERIGQVLEVQDTFVKVDAPFRRDYWLNAAYVLLRDDGRIETSFARRDLDAYKLERPDTDIEDPPKMPAADTVIAEAEQVEQRIQMERELAMQRRELPHTHTDGDPESAPSTRGGTRGEPVEAELERLGVPLPYEDAATRSGMPWRYVFGAFALAALGTAGFVGWRRMKARRQPQRALGSLDIEKFRRLFRR